MSSSILTELELQPTATETITETEIQEESETYEESDAKRFLRVGRFYWTNAGFPKELDYSKDEYTKSPLRSFHTLPLSRPSLSERELLRVSTDTTIRHKKIKGGKKGGKNPFNYRHPCYLVEYDKSTNQGVIFLGTSNVQDNAHRFAIVQSKSSTDPLLPGSLRTRPPYSFKEKKTYLNISHPLRVQFAYLLNGRFPRIENEGTSYDGHEPPRVAIANFAVQLSDNSIISNARLETSVVFDKESEQLFWEKHKKYHRQRPVQRGSHDDSGGVGPDDDSGGAGPNEDSGRARPNDGGSSTSGVGPSAGGFGPSAGGVGPSTSGVESTKGGFSLCKVEDAPWGRVGDQRIGIDIPLVTEDIYSDSDEEMDLEEIVINSKANDAPWGRVGDQRIGIDIPLLIEDISLDLDEEMDLESIEEFQEVDNGANVVKLESSSSKGITTWPNPSDKDSSWSYTIPKPYFVVSMPFESVYALLHYDHLAKVWAWTRAVPSKKDTGVSIEGLVYEPQIYFDLARGIFNWHTKEYIVLPPPPDERFNSDEPIVGMIVDTSVRPYGFKVIEGSNKGTVIYDSTTHSWTHRLSVPPQLSKYRFSGYANVASCKGVVFIIDRNDQIVLYDTEKDKWDCVRGTREHVDEQLCGIGSWDDRVFSSTILMSEKAMAIEIWELVGMAKPEWKVFDAMPGEMCSWLKNGADDCRDFRIDVSYCSENLLIWAWFYPSARRFVLCNLARKTWEKLEPPPFLSSEGFATWRSIDSALLRTPDET